MARNKRVPNNFSAKLAGRDDTKQVRQVEKPEKFRVLNFSWRMNTVDLDGKWAWGKIPNYSIPQFTEKFKQFESMTLQQLEDAGSHSMPKDKICKEARERLAEIELDDIDELFSFRMAKRVRVWAIRDGSVFKLIWFDPHHTVYPMNIADN